MELAPIVLFVYNRPRHTLQTLESLMANDLADESELFIYADGPKENSSEADLENIKLVREGIRSKAWCKKVHLMESDVNLGLANSVINGVSETVNKFGKIIVLEDDLVLSVGFLEYMNNALDMYMHAENVAGVSGYVHPVKAKLPETFFLRVGSSWGWGTWDRVWKLFNPDAGLLLSKIKENKLIDQFNMGDRDFFKMLIDQQDGKIDSWAIRFYASFFLEKKLFLFPGKSLLMNIGYDASGTHSGVSGKFDIKQLAEQQAVKVIPVEESKIGWEAYKKFFRVSIKSNLKNKLRRIRN